jgi:hypothetical protein
VQVVDVRDLGDFTVTCIERKQLGVYNAVSPDGKFTIKDVVDSCVRVAGAGTSVEWVDAEFLAAQGVQAWQHMPAWVPNDAPGYRGFGRMSTAKSIAAGLKTRDLDETNRDTLAYYTERGEGVGGRAGARSSWSAGASRSAAGLIRRWRRRHWRRGGTGRPERVRTKVRPGSRR